MTDPERVLVADAVAALRSRRSDELAAVAKRLADRGIEPVAQANYPATDEELRCDYWWYQGMVHALEDLLDELTAEIESVAAVSA